MTPLDILIIFLFVIILGYCFYATLSRSWYHGLRKHRSYYNPYDANLFSDDDTDKENNQNDKDDDENNQLKTSKLLKTNGQLERYGRLKKLNFTL